MQKPLRRCACVFVLALAFMATGASILRGQTVTATLTGTIADQTGAIVPGVTVTAINQGTQIEYTAESNSAGVYTIPFLPIGTYVSSAETTYVPIGKNGIVYTPAEFDSAVYSICVPWFMAVTVTPGTIAPVWSAMVPVRVAVTVWPRRIEAPVAMNAKASTKTHAHLRRGFCIQILCSLKTAIPGIWPNSTATARPFQSN